MAKILLINPNKWGRGISHIWIASHSGIIKKKNHKVELFDATFYQDWSLDEIKIQTDNKNYKPTDYHKYVNYNKANIFDELQKKINIFKPDVIFWSAISSHIHAEGEYNNIQNGYELIKNLKIHNILKITGGLQATAAHNIVLEKMPKIDFLIRGESELVLLEILDRIDNKNFLKSIDEINGLVYFCKEKKKIVENKRQVIIKDLDAISPYDYDIFDEQVFIRPYNGKLLRAVDYEISRGCIYSCNYCVETIIQKYYNFLDYSQKTGAIKNFQNYLRTKSSGLVLKELEYLIIKKKIELIRCQDTNFLTNKHEILLKIADDLSRSKLKFKMYIETRPEGINLKTIELLKKLNVDGVGMGVELSDMEFREKKLNRFANQEKTIEAFKLLKQNNIRRTAYNIIGLPGQDEESILSTIKFNQLLNPDNITVAYYSPYYGTKSQIHGAEIGIFDDYEFNVDSALRTKSKDKKNLTIETLEFYKKNFVKLVHNGF